MRPAYNPVLTIHENNNAAYNLACEDVLLAGGARRFMLWRNGPSVIIGRHQNTRAEADVDFAQAHNINIIRRLSGGGAVYHDLGNVNFTMIQPYNGQLGDFSGAAALILEFLRDLGVPAQPCGRNDLTADGRKFSGGAQAVRGGHLLTHGTVLFDADLDTMTRVLTVGAAKYEGRGIASVRGRVVNLREYLPDMTKDMFWERVKGYFTGRMEICPLTHVEDAEAEELARGRYGSWEWNFGNSPKYTFAKTARFDAGCVQAYVDVSDGIVKGIRICGDFFTKGDLNELERVLYGVRHEKSALSAMLSNYPVADVIVGLSNEQLLSVLV